MSSRTEGFLLTSSPHQFASLSVKRIMYLVVVTLLPAVVMSVLFFGAGVILRYLAGVVAAVVTEAVVKIIRKRDWRTCLDGSAIITGLLLVMTVPPDISPVFVALGSIVAVFIGKELFGGLGANIINPALVGRAFLAAAYPVQMTTWAPVRDVFGFLAGAGGAGAAPAGAAGTAAADAVTSATPLAAAKFEHTFAGIGALLFGQTGGSIGETCALAILLGGIVLIALRLIRWRITVSYLGSVFVLSGIFWLIDPATYGNPLFQLFSGGLMLGAFYMATDMVTSPFTHIGGIIFGAGAGLLVVIIRLFGGFPEGVMYSILLMNAITPLLNRFIINKKFGAQPKQATEASK